VERDPPREKRCLAFRELETDSHVAHVRRAMIERFEIDGVGDPLREGRTTREAILAPALEPRALKTNGSGTDHAVPSLHNRATAKRFPYFPFFVGRLGLGFLGTLGRFLGGLVLIFDFSIDSGHPFPTSDPFTGFFFAIFSPSVDGEYTPHAFGVETSPGYILRTVGFCQAHIIKRSWQGTHRSSVHQISIATGDCHVSLLYMARFTLDSPFFC
jgi:hypothetical protein